MNPMADKIATPKSRSIHILQMGKHFLYLPIYYAAHKHFFGFLPTGVEVVIDEPIVEHTDSATYQQMMDESKAYNGLVMAITDPIQIFKTPLNSKRLPAVLATLVTNGAFWAINHGSHGRIGCLKNLSAFDRIIAYAKGTTSYNIAARIALDSGCKKPLDKFIRVVNPGEELLLLSDADGGANAVALSPDILHIEHLVSPERRTGFCIELPIGDTDEYNDVIVTALIANNDFVLENHDAVTGILKGIQQSLKVIHAEDADVLRFTRSYFRYAEKAEGALKKAISAGVVPRTIAIAQSHWRCAAKANREESGNNVFSETQILEYYRACIEPYERLANESIKSIETLPIAPPMPFWKKCIPIVYIVLTIVITAMFGWIKALLLVFGFLSAWLIIQVGKKAGRIELVKRVKHIKLAFFIFVWLAGIASIIVPFVPMFDLKEKKLELVLFGVACLITAGIETLKHVERQST